MLVESTTSDRDPKFKEAHQKCACQVVATSREATRWGGTSTSMHVVQTILYSFFLVYCRILLRVFVIKQMKLKAILGVRLLLLHRAGRCTSLTVFWTDERVCWARTGNVFSFQKPKMSRAGAVLAPSSRMKKR